MIVFLKKEKPVAVLIPVLTFILSCSMSIAQDTAFDDQSEAAAEELNLDAALEGDLLGDDSLLAEELPALEEAPAAEPEELDMGDLEVQPADDEFDLSEIQEPVAEPAIEEVPVAEPVPPAEIEIPAMEDLAVDSGPALEEVPAAEPIDFDSLIGETLDETGGVTIDTAQPTAPPATAPMATTPAQAPAAEAITQFVQPVPPQDTSVDAAIMEAVAEGIPEAPDVPGVHLEVLEDLSFAENLAIIKRQASEMHALDQLEEGDEAYSEGDYERSIARYKYAYNNLGRRPDTKKYRERAKIGIAKSYYAQALSRYKSSEMEEAEKAVRLARDYGHPKATKLLQTIQEGPPQPKAPKKRYTRKAVVGTQEYKASAKRTSYLLWLGRQRYQVKQYQKSREAFEAVLKLEPQNTEAIRMLRKIGLIEQDRATLELESTRETMMGDLRRTWNPRHYRDMDEKLQDIDTDRGQMEARPDMERERILNKMRSIKIPEIDFRMANINDVVEFLANASQEFDTAALDEGQTRGVNIILKLGSTGEAAAGPAAAAVPPPEADPFAAMGAGGAFEEPGMGAGAGGAAGEFPLVTFTARGLTLLEALDIVTDYCNLKWRVEGSVVKIVRKDEPDDVIIHRWYPVMNFTDIITGLAADMEAAGGGAQRGGGEFIELEGADLGGSAAQGDWRAFFEGLGVPWPTGSAIKYLPGIGKLMVANTADNLALFETILEQFDFIPKQIEIEARFVEINQNDLDALGMELKLTDDWDMLRRKGDASLPLSAQPSIRMMGNDSGGGFTVGNRFLTDGVAKGELPIYDDILHIASVLTNPELDFVLHAIRQKGNTDLLSAPKVTAQSGEEATIKVVQEYIYPTEFTVSGVTGGVGAGGMVGGMVGAVVEPGGFETREVGVILSVLPEVSTEGQMINLTVSPEVCEFIRWEEFGSTFTDANGRPQQLRMPQPIFHTRSVATRIMIFNEATVVMGGMITEKRTTVDDKIPFIGDIPLIGRLFSSSFEQSEKRNLMVFVTARMVRPDGRAVRSAEEITLEAQKVSTGTGAEE